MNLKQIQDDDSLLVVQEANEKVRFQFYWLAERVELLEKENAEWKEKFHARCDVQLDEFRKNGMQEAAIRCKEIADSMICHCGIGTDRVGDAIAREFNLPKAG